MSRSVFIMLSIPLLFAMSEGDDADSYEEESSRIATSARYEVDFIDDDVARDGHWYGLARTVFVGRALETTYNRPVIHRVWADTAIDTTFGETGAAITTVGFGWGWFHAVDIDSNNKALAVGRVWRGSGNSYNFLAQRFLTNGALDTGFDADGTLYLDPSGGGADFARDVLIQSDDKAYIVGYGGTGTPPNYDIQIYRILTNGAPDTTWGTAGLVSTAILPANDLAHAAMIGTDGKLIVAGSTNAGADEQAAILRYETDGTLDPHFGAGGVGYLNFNVAGTTAGGQDRMFAMDIDESTGKYVMVGRGMGASNWDSAVARVNTDGTLDATFGTAGTRLRAWSGNVDWQSAVRVLTQESKIFSVGREQASSRGGTTRLFSDGADDTTYSSDGKTVNNFGAPTNWEGLIVHESYFYAVGQVTTGGQTDFAVFRFGSTGSDSGGGQRDFFKNVDGRLRYDGFNDVANNYGGVLLTDGYVVTGGLVENGAEATRDMAIVRMHTDGSLDTSFGTDGANIFDLGFGTRDESRAFIADNEGKYLLAAYENTNTNGDFTIIRFMTDGSRDSTFGAAGIAVIDFNGRLDVIEEMAIDTSGKIVAIGHVRPSGSNIENWGIARLNTDGTLDATFATAGRLEIDFTGDDDFAYGLAVDGANRIYMGGYTEVAPNDGSGTEGDFALMRFLSDGAVDSTFATDGSLIFPVNAGARDWIEAILIDTTGKIMVTGQRNDAVNTDQRMFVARLLTDGSFDTSFGTGGQDVSIDWNLGRSVGRCLHQFHRTGHYMAAGNQVRHYRTDGSLYTIFADNGDASENATVRKCMEGPNGLIWTFGQQSSDMIAGAIYP